MYLDIRITISLIIICLDSISSATDVDQDHNSHPDEKEVMDADVENIMNSDGKVLTNCELKKDKTIIAVCNKKWPPLSSSSFRGRNRMEQFSSG